MTNTNEALVRKEAKFKAGDRVRVIDDMLDGDHRAHDPEKGEYVPYSYIGRTGVVAYVNEYRYSREHVILFDEPLPVGADESFFFFNEELEAL